MRVVLLLELIAEAAFEPAGACVHAAGLVGPRVVEASATDEEELKQLSNTLWKEHAYDPNESDRVILNVEMKVTDGSQPVCSGAYALDEHGNTTGSAMARLVSKTVSIAVEAVLDGELPPGVSAAPSNPQIVDTWMTKLIASGERIVRS